MKNQDNINWNAQRNLRSFLKEQIDPKMTYQEVSANVQKFFTSTYPSRFWIVYVYDNI